MDWLPFIAVGATIAIVVVCARDDTDRGFEGSDTFRPRRSRGSSALTKKRWVEADDDWNLDVESDR